MAVLVNMSISVHRRTGRFPVNILYLYRSYLLYVLSIA